MPWEDIRFSDDGVMAFFRSYLEYWRLLLVRSKLFLFSPTHIQTNTREGDKKMQGIGSKALKNV